MSNPLRVIFNGLMPFMTPGSGDRGVNEEEAEMVIDEESSKDVGDENGLKPTIPQVSPIPTPKPNEENDEVEEECLKEDGIAQEIDKPVEGTVIGLSASSESTTKVIEKVPTKSLIDQSTEGPSQPVKAIQVNISTPESTEINPPTPISSSKSQVSSPAQPSTQPTQPIPDSKSRKLRSQDKSTSTQTNPALFHFDLEEIKKRSTDYWELPLKLVFDRTDMEASNISHPTPPPAPIISEYTPPSIRIFPSKDPLSDDIYLTYHRRMERDEKGIQRIEREKTAIELDAMTAQRELLEGPSWRRDILRITAINDPNDQEELEQKKELTLKEIDMYLTRYQTWKRKETLARNNKQIVETPPPEPKMILRLPTLQGLSKRKEESSKPQSQSQPQKHITSFFRPYTVRPRFDQLIKRHHRNNELLAFGQPIPEMTITDFDIPSEWKSGR